jgi:hypothetical protein
MKTQIFVMPAWTAGIQACRMPLETSMLTWIPALHAGMTQSLELTGALHPYFLKRRTRRERNDREPMTEPVVRLRSTFICCKKAPPAEIV